jgi:hypothetical protein
MNDTASQPVTHPSIHIFEPGNAVILQPPLLEFFQFINTLIKGSRCGFSANGIEFLFQGIPSLVAYTG